MDCTLLFVRPELTSIQFAPLLVERLSPPIIVVPAKTELPLLAKELTIELDKSELIFVQLAPLFVERKTPPPIQVPA